MLEVKNLRKSFGDNKVLNGIDVKIKKLIEKVQDLSSVLPADGIHMKYFGIKIVNINKLTIFAELF